MWQKKGTIIMESEKVKSVLKEIGKDVVVGGSIVTLAASVLAATPSKAYEKVLRNEPAIEKTLTADPSSTNVAKAADSLYFNFQTNNTTNGQQTINFSIQPNQQLPDYNVALPVNIVQGSLEFIPREGDLITNINIQGNLIANMGEHVQQWVQEGTINITDPRTNEVETVSFAVPVSNSFNSTNGVQVILRSYDNQTITNIEGNYSVTIESGKLTVEDVNTGQIRNISYAVEQQAVYPPYQYQQPPTVLTPNQELLVDVLTVVVVVSAIIAGLLESGK